MIYNLFPKFQMRHEWFSFYGLRMSDEGADTVLIYKFLPALYRMFLPFHSLYYSINGNGMPSHENQMSGQHKQINMLSNLMHVDLRIRGYLNLL